MKRLHIFCAEYARRPKRPVLVGTSLCAHVLGFAVVDEREGEDLETIVGGLREAGLRDAVERPEEWRYVKTTYREVDAGELLMVCAAVLSVDQSSHPESKPDSPKIYP